MDLCDPLVAPTIEPLRQRCVDLLEEVRRWQRSEAGTVDQSETGALAMAMQMLAAEAEDRFPLAPEQMITAHAFELASYINGFPPLQQRVVWERVGRLVAQTLAEIHARANPAS